MAADELQELGGLELARHLVLNRRDQLDKARFVGRSEYRAAALQPVGGGRNELGVFLALVEASFAACKTISWRSLGMEASFFSLT